MIATEQEACDGTCELNYDYHNMCFGNCGQAKGHEFIHRCRPVIPGLKRLFTYINNKNQSEANITPITDLDAKRAEIKRRLEELKKQ